MFRGAVVFGFCFCLIVFLLPSGAFAEKADKASLMEVRAKNPWLFPMPSGLVLEMVRADGSERVTEELREARNLGMTFSPASFSLLRPNVDVGLEWLEADHGKSLVLVDESGKIARHAFGNGPTQGGTWWGYFSAGATRWVCALDEKGRIVKETYYYQNKDVPEFKEEQVVTAIDYTYEDAFSESYPRFAKIEHRDMRFEVEFMLEDGRWMVKQSKYFLEGTLDNTLTITKKG